MGDSPSRGGGCRSSTASLSIQRRLWGGSVPHSGGGVAPMSSLSGAELLGSGSQE
jgi:hypothetical protein